METNRKIGWIGTGIMGSAMCGHLVDAGHDVVVTNRTPERARRLVDRGATWADTPADVAAASTVVFSIVSTPQDVRQVALGPHGIFVGAVPGTVLIEMTTSEPSLAVELAHEGAPRGIHVLDAPVTGGDIGARNGTLSIMVGGPVEVLDEVQPLLEQLGTVIVHQGSHGAGQRAKIANQIIIAGEMVAICEALLFAERAGLDPTTMLTSVGAGAARSALLENLAPRIVQGDMAPGFLVDHFVKDLGIALGESTRMQLALPGLALAHQLYVAVQAHGHGRDGTQALIHALASLSTSTWR